MLPILLIHGFPFDATMWQHQALHLRAKGYTVLTPTLPGFGGTAAWPRERSTIDAFAEYVHEMIERETPQRGGGRAIVGGFSMGGYVLFSLLRLHPEDVAAAMFIDTRPDADSAEARARRMRAVELIDRDADAFMEEQAKAILSKKPDPRVKEQVLALMRRQFKAGHVTVGASAHGERPGGSAGEGGAEGVKNALFAMAHRRDSTDFLAGVKVPVLVVVGAEDSVSPASVALHMQSQMPQAMVAQIVSAGHLTPVEGAGAVNGAMDNFIATMRG